jgi:hypothetical protein
MNLEKIITSLFCSILGLILFIHVIDYNINSTMIFILLLYYGPFFALTILISDLLLSKISILNSIVNIFKKFKGIYIVILLIICSHFIFKFSSNVESIKLTLFYFISVLCYCFCMFLYFLITTFFSSRTPRSR